MKNQLIIMKISETDLSDLSDEQLYKLCEDIITTVNLRGIKKAVDNACLNLSSVTEPCFMADLNFIATDNQKRLNLIWSLLHNFDLFESDVKYMKKLIKKGSFYIDSEHVYNFLYLTQEMTSSIKKFGDFKKREYEYNQQTLEENKQKYLKGDKK